MAKGREKTAKKGRKKSKKKIAAGALAGILVISGIGAAVYAKVSQSGEMPKEVQTAQSASAQLGSISNTIVGTGNLALQEAEALTVPSGIKIQEVFVESGDVVAKGETLATVDEASVLTAVGETQNEIKELDEQISECQEDDDEDCIEAAVAGRVKIIYAAAEDEVTEVMLENGALMVLSLDGKMAVDLTEVSGVEEGGTMTVTLSSGTAVTGTVESVSGSSCTITVTDNGTLYGDVVSVTDSDGAVAGEGTLYIHQPLEITGTVGTVESVDVSENTSVSAGTQLLTLEGTASQSQYQELLAEREARSQTLKKLLLLTKNQEITAEASGTIQSVNVAASASTSSESVSSSGTSSSGVKASSVSMVPLSFSDGSSESVPQNASEIINGTEGAESMSEIVEEGDTAVNQTLVLMIQGSGECTSSVLAIETPAAGNVPVTDVGAADGSYCGIVTWNPADAVFGETADYRALVILSAGEGYQFSGDSIQGTEVGTVSGINVSQDGKTLELQIAYPQTGSSDGQNSGDNSGDNTGDNSSEKEEGKNNGGESQGDDDTSFAGDDNAEESGSGNGKSDGTGDGNAGNESNSGSGDVSNSSGQGNTGTNQSGSGQSSSGTQSGTMQSAAAEDTEKTSLETSSEISSSAYSTDVTAFTISPDDYMQLSVNVDELDINSVEAGQKAVVTFDAIEDEEFEGEVASIGNTASVNGGVAKYTVSLTVPKDDRMREGMNASATITIESKENVITLPMNALQEQGNRVFVYTRQGEDGTLSGEQEVTTGLSDGSTVEITEGLSEGETVYYNRTGNIQGSSSGDDSGFGGMGGFGGAGGSGSEGGFSGDGGSRPERSNDSSGGMGGGNPGQSGATPPNM